MVIRTFIDYCIEIYPSLGTKVLLNLLTLVPKLGYKHTFKRPNLTNFFSYSNTKKIGLVRPLMRW